MKAIMNLKRGFNAARTRWMKASHALNRQAKFEDHSNPVRAGRALTECDFVRYGLQPQRIGGGCNVSLQPRFLGIADGQ